MPPFPELADKEHAELGYYGRHDHSALLIDAVLKEPYPPVSLPKREFMEHARELWQELDLPELQPRSPWHGYTLGQWRDDWDEEAMRATRGQYAENGLRQAAQRSERG
jgi:4-hydroxy-3-polyprenylbenzoate decarboxylase